MNGYDRIVRKRLRDATAHFPRTEGVLSRDGALLGAVSGFYYEKRLDVYSVSIPGQAAGQPDGRYLMALYPDEFPDARPGDRMAIGSEEYVVLGASDWGAYRTFQLEALA